MQSGNDMFERGVRDAESDDLNPFYYQHYYYYRRGYDSTRRRLRRTGSGPAAPPQRFPWSLLGIVAALALLAWFFWPQISSVGSQATPTVTAIASSARTEVSTALPRRTATPRPLTPTPAPLVLAVGGRARVVNLNGAPLRARSAPGVQGAIQARIPEGSEVTLLEGPVEADGFRWWRVESPAGSGWSAEGSPEGAVYLEPIP